TETLYAAAPAGAPFPPDRVGDADDLRRWRDAGWILATPGTLCHTMTVRACEAAGFTPKARHSVDDFAAVLRLVAVGQGVALVPELAVAEGTSASVALTALPLRRHTEVAYRRGAGDHPAVRAFTTALASSAPAALRPTPADAGLPGEG
ncbi:MAG: LysR family transcriptional regulator, partial [Streptomycetaceae bacterium]|nr:LysR family transcriptional regulator [Streptomycetaceae bacterium]